MHAAVVAGARGMYQVWTAFSEDPGGWSNKPPDPENSKVTFPAAAASPTRIVSISYFENKVGFDPKSPLTQKNPPFRFSVKNQV